MRLVVLAGALVAGLVAGPLAGCTAPVSDAATPVATAPTDAATGAASGSPSAAPSSSPHDPAATATRSSSATPGSSPGPSTSATKKPAASRTVSPTTPSTTSATATAPRPGTALAAVATLTVKGRAPLTGYERSEFGQAWADVDRNGCDTRNDVLGRDLVAVAYKPGTRGCVVASGLLVDPYSGDRIDFLRGQGSSTEVQIDHVVALADAWQKGAQRWDAARRERFANDPLNLRAVDGPTNASKGAGDTATWLPPRKAFRCEYVARQVAVKSSYGLSVTAAERDAMRRVLATCPRQSLPTSDPVPGPGRAKQSGAAAEAKRAGAENPGGSGSATSSGASGSAGGGSVYYANCDAARAAGAAPVHEGDPGYSRRLDRDGDGVGCE